MAIPIFTKGTYKTTENLDAAYTWDNLGRMTSMGIPLGATYQYAYDAMSNLSGLTGTDGYTASAQYNWAGMRTSLTYAPGPGNTPNLTESRTYSSLLQLSRLTTAGTLCPVGQQCAWSTVLDMEYLYTAGQNNGRITQSIDHVLNETVNYTYDSLNRLLSAEEVSSKWGNAFSYDGWGTLNGQTWTPGNAATPGNVNPGPVDANGNNVGGSPGNPFFTYDVENRMVAQTNNSNPPQINGGNVATWGYDPWNKRVSASTAVDDNGGNTTAYTAYGVNGRRLASYQLTINDDGSYTFAAVGTNLYFGGTLIASNGLMVATDRLGSVRSNGNAEQIAYYPYGLERILPGHSGITPDGRDKFGTYFRDSSNGSSGQDYADQRYYNQAGAFWSADPAGISGADPTNPTTLNMYAYAGDDPVNASDPTGLVSQWPPPVEPPPVNPFTGGGGTGGSDGTHIMCTAMAGFTNCNAFPTNAFGYLNSIQRRQAVNAITNLVKPCQDAITEDGIDLNQMAINASQTNFYSSGAYGSMKVSDISGYINPDNPAMTLNEYLGGGDAAALLNGNDDIINSVALAGSYFNVTASWATNRDQSQNIALVHEELHIIANQDDFGLALQLGLGDYRNMGFASVDVAAKAASTAISTWLANDCFQP